jgi:hypothetical protein
MVGLLYCSLHWTGNTEDQNGSSEASALCLKGWRRRLAILIFHPLTLSKKIKPWWMFHHHLCRATESRFGSWAWSFLTVLHDSEQMSLYLFLDFMCQSHLSLSLALKSFKQRTAWSLYTSILHRHAQIMEFRPKRSVLLRKLQDSGQLTWEICVQTRENGCKWKGLGVHDGLSSPVGNQSPQRCLHIGGSQGRLVDPSSLGSLDVLGEPSGSPGQGDGPRNFWSVPDLQASVLEE